MLEINMEFRKGILFVRLSGELTKKTFWKLDEDVTCLIKDNGIRNVVFNVSDLRYIDAKGISFLFYNYELCHDNKGRCLVCGLVCDDVRNRFKSSRLLNYMLEVSDELLAIEDINV
ncbi:MAG: STAS domain-containing protein [Bacilli bacterium]